MNKRALIEVLFPENIYLKELDHNKQAGAVVGCDFNAEKLNYKRCFRVNRKKN
ncbi:hypothetical protein [Holdemania filiformis]|uniref:hypothetical protein n=1 Tax=Holdemania filiformis TaxID=61171 RepID=UPI0022E8E3F6|nr:hypothetical protein [Holdemania filiformis]